MEKDLKKDITKGISWNLIETIVVYVIRFCVGVILARLLMPSDFGLISMVAIFISISDIFVKAGFSQAFIRKQDATDIDANTVFYLNLGIGVLMYLILFFSAPLISSFFSQPELVNIVRILGLSVVIYSFNVIQFSMIRKYFQFKRKACLVISTSIISGCVAVFCAYKGLGVWSLVIDQLLKALLMCVGYYLTSSWRPSFSFSSESAKSMFSYGGWLLLTDLFATLMNNFYRISIGKLYTSSELGYYDRAYSFRAMVADTFTWVLGMVAFPSFSKIQQDNQQLRLMVGNFVKYSSFIIFPVLGCLFVVAEPVVLILLTEKWIIVASYLRILCLVGFFAPIVFFIAPLLQALGFSKITFRMNVFLFLLRVVNVVLTLKYNIYFLLYGELLVQFIYLIVTSFCVKNKLQFNYLSVLLDAKKVILFTFLSLLLGEIVVRLMIDMNVYLKLILPCVTIVSSYAILFFIFENRFLLSVFRNIKSLLRR